MGIGDPPPPSRKKFPNNPVFADFFPELTDQDPKSNYLKVIKLIRYHLPPIVKHVLAPQNDFSIQKILDQFTKVLGIEKTPPPPPMLGKIPKIIIFLSASHIVCDYRLAVGSPNSLWQIIVPVCTL